MWYDWGNTPVNSTNIAQPVANPSTATLCAEIDSTQLGTQNLATGQSKNFRVTWILGADTNATFQCESASSTNLNAGVDIIAIKTATAQSGQFVTNHVLGPNYRLRARVYSSFTGNVVALIQAEPVT